ncbi:MAG: hypothetical protein HYY93_01685 [Planctomycetes bacterium]|nr:hypothetical protein [Planctomycetota bacterium]
MPDPSPDIACIIARGDFESLRAAATFLCAAAAMRSRVEAFWTDAALPALVRGELDSAPVASPRGDGLRAVITAKGAAAGTTTGLLADARALGGLRLLACSGAVALYHLTEAEVLKSVDAIEGYPQFLERARGAAKIVTF